MTDQDLIKKIKRLQAECQEALNELAEMKARKKTPEQEARELLNMAGYPYVDEHVDLLARFIRDNRELKKLCGLMNDPDVVLEWVNTDGGAPGWPRFKGCPMFQNGDIFHCYKVAK